MQLYESDKNNVNAYFYTTFYATGPWSVNKNVKTDEGMYNLHIYYTSY